jgi:uracil-DNA glycosylase
VATLSPHRPARNDLFEVPHPAALATWDDAQLRVHPSWQPVVDAWAGSPEGVRLSRFLCAELASGAVIYPPDPLRVLRLTALDEVRVVILGQDPYHGPGQAEGLAFSVPPGQRIPPSLRNMLKELARDTGEPCAPDQSSLVSWAERGVLLLNTCLTVRDGSAASHARQGWEALADGLLAAVAARRQPCAYLLWGAHAQARKPVVLAAGAAAGAATQELALVLEANHPSPLSAARPPVPFVGCGHFSVAQQWLAGKGLALSWALHRASGAEK